MQQNAFVADREQMMGAQPPICDIHCVGDARLVVYLSRTFRPRGVSGRGEN